MQSKNLQSNSAVSSYAPDSGGTNVRAMSVATSLFFMWGFVTSLNDTLIPHLKSVFDLDYTQAMLVQFAFFSSYFVFAFPAGKVIEWIGYKRTMVVGLATMTAGALLFIPASRVPSFALFLAALIVLAAGITVSSGSRESIRCKPRPTSDRVKPPQSRTGVQLLRNISGSDIWRLPHSVQAPETRYLD